jgi:hypothetical protein
MITCQTFRANLQPNESDPELLSHLRTCDLCVEHAVTVDPDNFFRLLGGDEMVPPGGIDAFATGVMAQIRLREAETSLDSHRVLSWPRRLAIAATIAAGVTGGVIAHHMQQLAPVAPMGHPTASLAAGKPLSAKILTTKPIIETYQSQNATIVEVPTDGANVVMIVDDNLPADL